MKSSVSTPFRIALLGAESTGKTQLAEHLLAAMQSCGVSVTHVPETLRQWCDAHKRTPQVHEQSAIAMAQADKVLSVQHGWVIADTTALMTAIYSDFLFQDPTLYAMALQHQALFDVTLLMGLDLPWVPDGLQRDGAHVRAPVDGLLRQALSRAKLPFQVVYGHGPARLNAALWAVQDKLIRLKSAVSLESQIERTQSQFGLNQGRSAWRCDLCSDAGCEHRVFSDVLKQT